MTRWTVKTKPGCPFCERAENIIMESLETGDKMDVQLHDTQEKIAGFKMMGYKTFPQIWRDGEYIGGCDALVEYMATEEEI